MTKSTLSLAIVLGMVLAINANTFFVKTNPPKTLGISKSSPRVTFDLDHDNVFDLSFTSLEEDNVGFCYAYPSEITSSTKWEGPIKYQGNSSYDNILYHNGFYFILDTITFQVLAVKDFKKTDKQYLIPSDFQNSIKQNDEYYEAFLMIDEEQSVLFIVTEIQLLSYDLKPFFKAVQNTKPQIPSIKNAAKDYPTLSSVNSVRHYRSHLYVVADNIVYLWLTASNGDVAAISQKFDETFFKTKALSAVDIHFYENYGFVLDSLEGVHAVNLVAAKQGLFKSEGLIHGIEKGQFIEIIKNSLNIITSTKRSTKLHEFIINLSEGSVSLYQNRVLDIYQAVSDIYSDGEFLYILTGFYNLIFRPLVPGNFQSEFTNDYILNYWYLFQMKAIVPVFNGKTSHIYVIKDNAVEYKVFEQESPEIECEIEDIPEGEYVFQLKVYQTACEEKTEKNDINSICQINQNIRFVIASQDAIGDVSHAEQIVKALVIGLGVMGVLVLIFWIFVRKYKHKYHTLESQFKFKQLKEVEPNGQQDGADKSDKIQEFGDIKPLDVNNIYGTGNGGGN